jgi:DNA-binding CsgD family transcriptional regulator
VEDTSRRVAGASDPVEGLRTLADTLRARLRAEVRDSAHPPRGLRHLVGWRELVGQLAKMEPSARRSVCVLQPRYFYDPEDPGVELTRAALERGVVTRLITRPASVAMHPLLPSIFPATRLGPVFLRAMVVDDERALIEGEDTVEGDRTAWFTTRPDLVEAVLEIWDRTLPLTTPILPPGTPPPLSQRQLDVARLVAVGEKDAAIARHLDMSARTVERDVRAILQELGARSRTEAVLLMRGRGVNGGQPHRMP